MPDLLREEIAGSPGHTMENTGRRATDRPTDRRPLQRLGIPPVPIARRDLTALDTAVHPHHERRAARRPLRDRRGQLPQLATHLLNGELSQFGLQQLQNPLNGDAGGQLHHRNEDRADQRRQQLDDRRERHRRENDQHDLVLLDIRRGVLGLFLESRRLIPQLTQARGQITPHEAQNPGSRHTIERAIKLTGHRRQLIENRVDVVGKLRPRVTDRLQPALAALRPLHTENDLEEVLEARRQMRGLVRAVHRPLTTTTGA
ncbi:hypothetical protein [Amycolatopsis regifaucium]|uniref:hypothetical protein n=1 Tax=Amycolatopsis regifaucium TaxID=546365 RepID=UPI001160B2DD|nr:hypothetical protein [Amycolatopsis regifaucium]